MKVKFCPIKKLYGSSTFHVYVCKLKSPDEDMEVDYNDTFKLVGCLPFIQLYEEYELNLTPKQGKYGTQYEVNESVSVDVGNITDELEYSMLLNITSEQQAKNIHSAYPNYIRLILNGEEDKIDVNKIHNVKEHRHAIYMSLIQEQYKLYNIICSFKDYQLTMDDAKEIDSKYSTFELVENAFKKNPYYILTELCKKNFEKVDKLILEQHPNLKISDVRCEALMLFILSLNERDGNTRIDANEMADYCDDIDYELTSILKPTAIKSSQIYYDDNTKYIARMDTYLKEVRLAERIKHLIANPKVWSEIDISKYRQVDDLTITEEGERVLSSIRDNSVSMLLGGGGSGKTTMVRALINMFEDNGISYTLVTPTGTSSRVLSEYTNRKSHTIHRRVLGGRDISSHVIIIDEFSFVGLDAMDMLISATDKDTKILICADEYQLPSIGCGNILKNLIDSEVVPIVRLTKVFRYGIGDIATVATDCRFGKPYLDYNGNTIFQKNSDSKDYKFIPIGDNPMEQILEEYTRLLDTYSPDDILILSPYNVGEFGTYSINSLIQEKYNPLKDEKEVSYKIVRSNVSYTIKLRVGDKVLNTVNWYDALSWEKYQMLQHADDDTINEDEEIVLKKIDITNGQFGKVRDIVDGAVVVQFDEDLVVFAGNNVRKLLLGNSCSVHKAQGNQMKAIISVTHKIHKPNLHRALIYVANSRAREQLVEIGDAEVINSALEKLIINDRDTFLCDLLTKGEMK